MSAELAHEIAAHESTRTRAVRLARDLEWLLSTAMDALDAGDCHVTREYIERAREAIAR